MNPSCVVNRHTQVGISRPPPSCRCARRDLLDCSTDVLLGRAQKGEEGSSAPEATAVLLARAHAGGGASTAGAWRRGDEICLRRQTREERAEVVVEKEQRDARRGQQSRRISGLSWAGLGD